VACVRGLTKYKKVCVEPHTSALNMTLPAAQLWRRPQKSIDSWYAAPAAVDQYLLPVPELQQTSCTSLQLSIDGTDRQMDGRTPYLYTDAHRQKQAGSTVVYDCTEMWLLCYNTAS